MAIPKESVAQNFQRVAPQVTSTTIVIDENTDAKKLRDDMLYVLKNTNRDNFLAYTLIIDAAVNFVKEQKLQATVNKNDGKISATIAISGKKVTVRSNNEIILLLEILKKLSGEGVISDLLVAQIKDPDRKYKSRYGIKATEKAIGILNNFKDKVGESTVAKSLIRKITSLETLNFSGLDLDSAISIEAIASKILDVIPAIAGVNVEEVDRIKASTEILFELQRLVEELEFSSVGLKLHHRPLVVISPNMTNHELLIATLDSVRRVVKGRLIDNLGSQHPAVINFEIFYSKVLIRVRQLVAGSGLEDVLDRPVADFVRDFENLENPFKGKSEPTFITELAKKYGQQKIATGGATSTPGIAQDFAKEFYFNTTIDILGNVIGAELNQGLKTPSRMAWINNLNMMDTVPELSTTLTFRIINRPRFVWEFSTNFFYNTLKPTPTSTAEDKVGRSTIFGSSWKFISSDNTYEVGLLGAISAKTVGGLDNLKDAKDLHSYAGINVAIRIPLNLIVRPYYEWQYQRVAGATSVYRRSGGLEVRLPDKYLLSGFYLNFQYEKSGDVSNNSTSFGINFPIVK